MKKAFIDQLFFGFFILIAIVTFVATVNDETSIRNRMEDLNTLARTSSQAMARYYELQIDMCTAQDVNDNILRQTKLGNMVLDKNLIRYKWMDTSGDGQPDTIQTTIIAHPYDTFWYRFLDKDSFTIGPFSASEPITMPVNVTLSFGSEGADYLNMVGTYNLDENGCVQNPRLILENSERSGLSTGDPIGSEFTSPPTYLFIVADGYNTFTTSSWYSNDYPSLSDTVTMDHCESYVTDSTSNPTVTINNKTVTQTEIFFEHESLNGDGNYEHFQIIPSSIWSDYTTYIGNLSGSANDKYQQFIAYADALNADNDPTNDINYTTDPNGQYKYSMEDLNGGGDQDFDDLVLDSTRVAIPNQLNSYTVANDGTVLLNCGSNQNPIVTLNGCPLTINEDTTTTEITWQATDLDGYIFQTTASSTNGSVVVNDNGTLSYTPVNNFYGNDRITFKATDDSGGVGFGYCEVEVIEVNDPPTIAGLPITFIRAGNAYNFFINASDVDNDILTISAQNLPAWLSLDNDAMLLTGTPTLANVGLYENIIVSVSDGRGGVASLDPFSIEVSDTNTPPGANNIPNHTVQENTTYSYDINPFFFDNDGDALSYTLNVVLNGTTNVTGNFNIINGVINSINPIQTGLVGSILTFTVTASDGKESISKNFNVTITNQSNVQIFHLTFDSDEEGFNTTYASHIDDNGEGKLAIKATQTSREQGSGRYFNFGPEYANKDVTISFDLNHLGGWESDGWNADTFRIYTNGSLALEDRLGNSNGSIAYGSKAYSINGKTDSDGFIQVGLSIIVSSTQEYIYIDNFNVDLQ